MATYLFELTRCSKDFTFPKNHLDHALSRKADGPPPPARSALYAFAAMGFGVSKYMDDLVAWTDVHYLTSRTRI
jgi:hypothetical protein